MLKNNTAYIDWEDVCFIDCETRSLPNQPDPAWESVTTTSTRRYAAGSYPILITWAFGLEGEVFRWETSDITRPPTSDELPEDLRRWAGFFAAFNSGFDRAILDRYFGAGVNGWLDMMAQGAASGLPFGLDRAAKACGHDGKVASGKKLIHLFCTPGGALPQDKPDEWDEFCEYADVDVIAMQHMAASTLPLPLWQWEEFWASERINDRGLPMDSLMLRGASQVAKDYIDKTNERVHEITDGVMFSVRQYDKQRAWVWDRVCGLPIASKPMIKAHRVHPDTGEDEYKLKLDRPVIQQVIGALHTQDEATGLTDAEYEALLFLEEREFGASNTPGKFAKALDALADPLEGGDHFVLPNQYVFNGAAQTGRFSSRGVQMHNLTNKTVGSYDDEARLAELLCDIGEGIEPVNLEKIEDGWGNVGKALSRMIRPAITAPEGRMLVWGDWSNIEARVLPWLACADRRLDIFREIDSDPSAADVYVRGAAGMYDRDPDNLMAAVREKDPEAKDLRQRGKIAELALGFAGGVGALQSMAANYGMAFEHGDAQDIVSRWRKANRWAVSFWDDLWEAFTAALRHPGEMYPCGRLLYQGFEYMGQRAVACILPDGRPLLYRNIREKTFIVYDDFEPDVVVERSSQLVFDGPEGPKKVWKGLLAENVTQGTAASVLRWTIRSLDQEGGERLPVVGHTHDEIITMPVEGDGRYAKDTLEAYMTQDFGWNKGLPTAADITGGIAYTKTLDN